MDTHDLTQLTLTEAAAQIERGELSPVALTEAYVARIEQHHPRLNAYLTISADDARRAAAQAEAELKRGEYRGLLHGIPLALKDNIDTAGIRTTGGSSFLRDHVPGEDAHLVERLKAAGAVILGKTNMHEWAFGVTNQNPWHGDCRNPHDPSRITGGSSGGSAAAVAARLCLAAFGTDTRGSVRIPAALCGAVGFKPTLGRLSLRGVIPLSHALDHAGPMARTAADAAALMQAVDSYDAADMHADSRERTPITLDDEPGDLDGWRIGAARDAHFGEANADVLAAFERAVEVLRGLGAEVIEIDLAFLREAWDSSRVILSADAAAYHAERLAANPDGFGADLLARFRDGQRFTAVEYAQAREAQMRAQHRLLRVFDALDLIVTPSVPMAAPRFDDEAGVERARARLSAFTAPFNVTGVPALSLPSGVNADRMPVGVQLVGRPWADGGVLYAGIMFERAAGL